MFEILRTKASSGSLTKDTLIDATVHDFVF